MKPIRKIVRAHLNVLSETDEEMIPSYKEMLELCAKEDVRSKEYFRQLRMVVDSDANVQFKLQRIKDLLDKQYYRY